MIQIENLKFKYSNSSQVTLNISSLKISKGEKLFLYGPSGSGKTTLLEILSGVLAPDHGMVKISGSDIAQLTAQQRDQFRSDKMGYIFQSFNLIPYLSVLENITLPLYLSALKRKNIPVDSELSEVQKITNILSIEHLLDKNVTQLSTGQQQRVAAARAILGHPEILLADEPSSALDHEQRENFLKLLFHLCQKSNITLLFVSHDRTLEYLFDRALSLPSINSAYTPPSKQVMA